MAAKPPSNETRQPAARRGSIEARRLWTKRWLILAALMALSLATRADQWATWWGAGLINPVRLYTLFVPLGAMCIVIRKSVRCRAWAIRRAWTGPLCLLAAWAMASVASRTDLSMLADASLMVTVLGCTLAVFGIESIRRFPTAWCMLALAIPLPSLWLSGSLDVVGRITATIAYPLARLMDGSTNLHDGVLRLDGAIIQGGRLLSVLGIVTLTWALCMQAPRRRILTALAITPLLVAIANLFRTLFETVSAAWFNGAVDGAAAAWLTVLVVVIIGVIHNTQGGPSHRAEAGRIRLWRQCSSQLSLWDRFSPVGAAFVMALATAFGLLH